MKHVSNRIYSDEMFNQNIKIMFLKDYPENTRLAYSRVLKRAKYLEDQVSKDLYDFNLHEIVQLLRFLSPTSYASALSSSSIIQNYIRWSIEQGLRVSNMNPLDAVVGDEFYKNVIDVSRKNLFTLEEIENITGGLVNFQDAAMIRGIFEGIMGHGYSELLNLKKVQLDPHHLLLQLVNEEKDRTTHREVQISEELMLMLIKAAEESEYYKNNGNPSPNIKAPTSKLVDNDFVFRSSILNVKSYERADKHLVLRRLKNVAEWFGQPTLTAINIRNSGMLYSAYQLYKETGKLEKNEIDYVCHKFNIAKLKGSEFYNVSRLKKEFLSIEKIIQVYEEE